MLVETTEPIRQGQIWLCFEGKAFTDKLNVGYERRKNQRYFQDFFRADVNKKKKGISTTDSLRSILLRSAYHISNQNVQA